jgi:hypothetical protein
MRIGSIDWHQWFHEAKQGSLGSFESQLECWWYWASEPRGAFEVDDSSQSHGLSVSVVPQPDQDLGFALEKHSTNALEMTTLRGARNGGGREVQGEVLCYTNPTGHVKHLYY